MSRFSFTPFGRGSELTKSVVQTAYDNIYTKLLSADPLTFDNFSLSAGIPEVYFRWGGVNDTFAHDHNDGGLADRVISDVQMPQYPSGHSPEMCVTHRPKSLMLVGKGPAFPAKEVPKEYYVSFTASSYNGGSFLVGTQPIVILTLASSNTGINFSNFAARVLVLDVSSQGFTFRYESGSVTNIPSGKSFFIYYVAIGSYPGTIIDPIGAR